MDVDSELGQPALRAAAEVIVAERGEELALPVEQRDLPGHHGTAARGLVPGRATVRDLSGRGHAWHPDELDPLDMTDDCASHNSAPCHVSKMMGVVKEQIPPFERF